MNFAFNRGGVITYGKTGNSLPEALRTVMTFFSRLIDVLPEVNTR
jgi:hypothetical protein